MLEYFYSLETVTRIAYVSQWYIRAYIPHIDVILGKLADEENQ